MKRGCELKKRNRITVIGIITVLCLILLTPAANADMPYWVSAHDYTYPVYWNARGINSANYVMNTSSAGIHVNSVYVEINNNFNEDTRSFEELGWVWASSVSTTTPYYFWALQINGQYWGGLDGLIGPAPKGNNTQLQIYMAGPTNTPWVGGYTWNFLINNSLVAQLEGINSCGCAHVITERSNTSISNYGHFWDIYSMTSTLGNWQLWGTMYKWYEAYWDPNYTWDKVNSHEVYFVAK